MFKKIVFLFVLCLMSLSSQAQFTFGAGGAFGFEGFLGVQARAGMGFNDTYDIQVTGTAFLRNNDRRNTNVDIDALYKGLEFGESLNLKPLAGLNVNFRKVFVGTVESSETKLGVNAGANMNIEVSDYNVYIEPKIVLGGFNDWVIAAGILF